jgi:phosphotransferase system HPr (HPr) family protein
MRPGIVRPGFDAERLGCGFVRSGRHFMTHESEFRQTVVVNLENGLHLIPCSQIAQLARRLDCELTINHGDRTADAKNVLDLIALAAVVGTKLELVARGNQAAEAIAALVALFDSKFESNSVQ